MNKANDFNQWLEGMKTHAIPLYNAIFTDPDNIYYVYNALLPQRADEFLNWKKPVLATTLKLDWQGYLPFESLPQVHNPKSGYIQNCNSSPFMTTTEPNENPNSSSYPKYFGIEPELTNRAMMALELAKSIKKINTESLLNLKWDQTYSTESLMVKQFLKPIFEYSPENDNEEKALEILRNWNRVTDEASTGATIAILAWSQLYDPIDQKEKDVSPIAAFKDAVEFLMKHYKTVEVRLDQVQFLRRGNVEFGLGGGPDILNAIHSYRDNDKLVAWNGDTFMMLIEFEKDKIKSSSLQQYGNSRNKESKHYNDQALLFKEKKLKPTYFYPEDVLKFAVRSYSPADH